MKQTKKRSKVTDTGMTADEYTKWAMRQAELRRKRIQAAIRQQRLTKPVR